MTTKQDHSRFSWFTRNVRWPAETVGFHLWIGLCAALPVETASNFGGWLARTFGPRMKVTARAYRHLRIVFPEKSREELERIVRAMWDNLGRTVAEYAHLRTITDPASGRVELLGEENVRPTFDGKVPGIAFSAHLANWEVMHIMGARLAKESTTIVRHTNNPMVQGLLDRCRNARGGRRAYKGTEGARAAVATLRRNGLVALLIDQRMSDGIPVPFFGLEAMTPSAPAQLALRMKAALYPVRLERLGPARFRLTLFPALELPTAGSDSENVAAIMTRANALLAEWIRARPQEWLWLHRRWTEEVLADAGA